ncbi:mercury methylation ferredoxin HgcB [Candidatus Latescibacterota bacterium]
MAGLRYLTVVATLKLDSGKCTGCGMCVEVCPHGVFVIEDGKAVIADLDACIECGACVSNCAFEALTVDKGVGCAAAVINDLARGTVIEKIAPSCDCSNNNSCC